MQQVYGWKEMRLTSGGLMDTHGHHRLCGWSKAYREESAEGIVVGTPTCEGLKLRWKECLIKTVNRDTNRQLQQEDHLQISSTESTDIAEVLAHELNKQDNNFNVTAIGKDLFEQIIDKDNMHKACKKVIANKGKGGADNMEVADLKPWLDENYDTLAKRLKRGKYKPEPLLRVEIPKDKKGKMRDISIPCVIDRMVQQAVVQVLTPVYEPVFSEFSYGFRPNRSAHDALTKIKEYADEGYVWCASLDLEKFFDMVNQSKLIQLISDRIKEGEVVSLIHRFVQANVMIDGVIRDSKTGVHQGGPLSPLLANILLNELDQELTRRGHLFVRYADDIIILKRSRSAARRAIETISAYLEKKLYLRVNREKSFVAHIADDEVKYLGFGFVMQKNTLHFKVHAKSLAKLQDKIRVILARSNGRSYEWRQTRLKFLIIGWLNYFKPAKNMAAILREIDKWMRRKIRTVYWKCWKKTKTKYRELKRLGIPHDYAYPWANSRKGYWKVAGSGILHRPLNDEKLVQLGWPTFLDRYRELKCQA